MTTAFMPIAAASGLIAVALGAFGAHALKTRLSAEMLAVYQTAVLYQFLHTLALLAVALLILHSGRTPALLTSGIAFTCGIVLFSGSLYLLSLTGMRWPGPITPVGGLAFMLGWTALFIAALRL